VDSITWMQMTSNRSHTLIPSLAAHVTKSSPSSNTSTTLWHQRLGHPSPSRLDFMAKTLLNLFLESNKICDVCTFAKHTLIYFPNSSIFSIKPFELFHCDIWGPYKVSYLSSVWYFFTVVDDFSCFTWDFFMHNESEIQLSLPISSIFSKPILTPI